MENQQQEQDLDIRSTITGKTFTQAEWCFQFDEDQPNVFAWSQREDDPGDLTFNIGPKEGANIVFRSPEGKTFTLFVREMSEASKEARSIQIAAIKKDQEPQSAPDEEITN